VTTRDEGRRWTYFVQVRVGFPWNQPASGATVSLSPIRGGASALPVRMRADVLGVVKFDVQQYRFQIGEKFRIEASIEDEFGVGWVNGMDCTVRNGGALFQAGIGLMRAHQRLPDKYLSIDCKHRLSESDHGAMVLADAEEMITALQGGLPAAATALGGKLLDGLIRLRCEPEPWWRVGWNGLTLGHLMHDKDTEPLRHFIGADPTLGDGFLDRVNATALVRNPGSHQKWTRIHMVEATAAWVVIVELANAWFGKPVG